jgi:16S rRNA (adenine1518-N6/adenine1519-N6)-dimethyltransferase
VIDPADPDQLFDLLKRHRIDARHSLGQHFLTDATTRDAIAAAAQLDDDDEVLEVGAGPGTLTVALAPRCRRLVAVEVDRRLISILRETMATFGNVEIVQADILRYDVTAAFARGGEVVAGNIPYNLTGALIEKLLQPEPRPKRLSLVVQKEVAERWTASTGASLATVAVQVFATATIAMTVPASSFTPPPRVDSALVVMNVRDRPAVHVTDLNAFFRFVEAVFQFRRKQLGGALGRISGKGSAEAAARLRDAGIDPQRRPQTLGLTDWEAIFRSFAGGGG